MTVSNSIVAKLAVAFVAVAMAFTLVAPSAKAQDVSSMSLQQLIALVNQLQAQISGQTGVAGSCTATFTRSLGQGSTGADVMALQKFLNGSADTQVSASGAGAPGMETSFYGPATAAAVSKFQVKYSGDILVPVGLTSPTGYFGPSSMAKANALCASGGAGTGTGTGATGALKGGAGNLDEVKFMSSLNNEEVGEGNNDVEVMGLEVTPENSDIALTAVKVTFDHSEGSEVNGSATRFNKYADEVTIWLDGSEIASIDADDFNRDTTGVYSKTVSLKKGAIIRDGKVGELVVAVSAVGNIDGNDVGEEWGVKLSNLRFEDAQGAIITESDAGDLDNFRVFSFQDFATASEQEFRVRSGNSDINNAQTIKLSTTNKTTGVKILSFRTEVRGTSDMNIDEIIVDWASGNATTSGMVTAAQLFMDGKRVGSESISLSGTSGTITFDNLDLDLDAGETYDFEVRVDVNKTSAGFVSGSTFSIDVSSSTNWYIEDENGDTVSTGKRSGSASSEDHKFVTEGLQLAAPTGTMSTKEVYNSTTPSASYGEFRMKVNITAVGDTLWVKEGAASSTTPTSGAGYSIVDSSGNIVAGTTTSSFSYVSGATYNSGNDSYEVGEGQTAVFELVVTHDPTAAGQYRVILNAVGFGTTSVGTGSTSVASPATSFRTGLQAISQ